MSGIAPGPPGNHPHADRPNWQPGDDIGDYLQRLREGLETFSERRAAAALGVSRTSLRRWMLAATLPDELFERLLSARCRMKELAAVAAALHGGSQFRSVERCPHCGEVIRDRAPWRPATAQIVNDWLRNRSAA